MSWLMERIYDALEWSVRNDKMPDEYQQTITIERMKMLAERIVKIAKSEVGVEEINGTNCGPRVDEYKAATNLPPHESWPWCAAFVDWCTMIAMADGYADGTKYSFVRPKTAGAWDLENWSLKQDKSTNTKRNPERDIMAGDIVIFTFSHVGIATGFPDHAGHVATIEGNTDAEGSREGGGVFRKHRHITKIRSRIRFMV